MSSDPGTNLGVFKLRDVVIFEFAGRRANMELQMPLFRRILDEHPNVTVHIWNMARTWDDNQYLRSLPPQDRIIVSHDFYGQKFNDIWRHYALSRYQDHLIVKIDDDVVFFETERFGDFLKVVEDNRDYVVSAKVINNGASTRIDLPLWRSFKAMNLPLLDVHRSRDYADMAHTYAFDHWDELIGQPLAPMQTEDWVSINLVAVDHPMMCRIVDKLDKTSPSIVAGRKPRWPERMGDEGSVNTLPRLICQGFLAVHLGFGPQCLTDDQCMLWRKRYGELIERYLAA